MLPTVFWDRRDKALEIMKDSRIGTMGLVAILFGLAIKWGGIASLSYNRSIFLIIVPAYARAGILFGMRYLPYGRPDGTGKPFFHAKLSWRRHFGGLLLPIGLSLLLGLKALWLNLAFAIIIGSILFFYRKRMGCITGDLSEDGNVTRTRWQQYGIGAGTGLFSAGNH
jgi:adenosylcobinamide-GDP ribazoletransferase